jgi:hypothetical protein
MKDEVRKNQLYNLLLFYFGIQTLHCLFSKTSFETTPIATRVKNKILAYIYELANGVTSSTTSPQSYQPDQLQEYDSKDITKWSRVYKSWKTRGKNLFDLFIAAGC